MLLDVIVILLTALIVFIGWKFGVARMLLVLLGNIISVLISTFLGDFLSPIIYDSYIGPKITESLSQSFSSSAQGYISGFESLPLIAKIAMNLTGVSLESELNNYSQDISNSLAQTVESTLSPLIISLMSIIISGLIFSLVYLLYRFLIMKSLLEVFKFSVFAWINSFLGGLCGLLVSAVLISFFAFMLRTITPYVTNMPILLSESTIYNSYIFYHFYSGNIFYKVISMF